MARGFWWGLLMCALLCGEARGAPVELSPSRPEQALGPHLSWLLAKPGSPGAGSEGLLQASTQRSFRPASAAHSLREQWLKAGQGEAVLWLKWRVNRPAVGASGRWVLSHASVLSAPPRLFVAASGRLAPIPGTVLPGESSRPLAFSVGAVAKRAAGRGVVVLYARMQGRAPPQWLLHSAALSTERAYYSQRRRAAIAAGAYLGFMALIIAISFFLFLLSRSTSQLWYVFYHGSLLAYLLLSCPLGWAQIGAFYTLPQHQLLRGLMLGMFVFWSALFGRDFLATRGQARLADGMFVGLMIYGLSLLVGLLLGVSFGPIPQLLGVASPLFILYAGWTRWRAGFRPARFYLLGQLAFTLSSSLMVLEGLGLLSSGLGIFWMFGGSALEALLLSLALLERIQMARQEHRRIEQAWWSVQAEAREHEQRLGLILDAVQGGVWDWELESRGIYVTPGFLERHGLSPQRPDDWWERLHPDDVEPLLEALQRTHDDELLEVEFRLGTPERWRWLLAQGRVMSRHDEGDPMRLVGTVIDISETKQAHQRLSRAQRLAALGQLLAGVAHEINNPNHFIAFNLPLLADALKALEPALEAHAQQHPGWQIRRQPYAEYIDELYGLIEDMRYGTERINALVQELRHFVRSHEVEKHRVCVEQVVGRVCTLAGKQMEQWASRFELEMAPDLPVMWAHGGKLEQLLLNLLLNAGQAIQDREGGLVQLSISQQGGSLSIEVRDNGPGIPDAIRAKIFDPFFTTKGDEQGTGLGLSISQQIVEAHGGQIDVESREGQGALFRVTLPIVQEPSP